MLNEEIIQEELENLGCTALDTTQYLDGISILEGTERVIFCKPVNQTNYVDVFKEVDKLLVDVMKNIPSDLEYFRRLQNEVE